MTRISEALTLERLAAEYTTWRTNGGVKQAERFGQRIWNLYGAPGVAWPELFYADNALEVYSMLSAEIYGNIQATKN